MLDNASVLRADADTIAVLWQRDCLRFLRQPSRLVGALGQPVIFWGVIGSGFASTFSLGQGQIGYQAFFYAGVVMMVALFSSIFASVSVIEDRHQGFLLPVLAGPGSRLALVLGKCLGSATVAALQISLFLLLAPLAGFSYASIAWPALLSALACACMGLSALGFAVAWWLDNVQAYHAVQMTLLVPLWVVSGAMFPADPSSPGFYWAMRANPLAYAVSAVRHALYGGSAPLQTVICDASTAQWVCLVFALVSVALATLVSRRHG